MKVFMFTYLFAVYTFSSVFSRISQGYNPGAKLKEANNAFHEKSEKNTKSNKGGWHSRNFKLNDKNSAQYKFALDLQKYILDVFQKFGWKSEGKNILLREMWSIINKKNDFNVIHTHPNTYLSAAYYVKAPKNCGKFIVENPNIAIAG